MENVAQIHTATDTNIKLLILLPLFLSATKFSLVGDKYVIMTSDEYNNGYPATKYHQVLDTFIKVYKPIIQKAGGEGLHILRDFSDGAVNAWAWKEGREYHLEVPGGMSKYYLITEEGFITTICHELGHLLGGAPLKSQRGKISLEGQSDYFSSAKCLKRILSHITPYKKLKADNEVERLCKGQTSKKQCKRAFSGMKSLTSYYAKLENSPAPSLLTESIQIVRQTIRNHPKAQCRLDTMKKGYFCPVDIETPFSLADPTQGACHKENFPQFARPRCWYKAI